MKTNIKIEIIKQIQASKNGVLLRDIVGGSGMKERKEVLDALVENGTVYFSTVSDLYTWPDNRKPVTEVGKGSNPMKKENMTSSTLREILFNEIQDLRNGQSDPNQAKAVAQIADKIIKSAQIEIDYKKMRQEFPDIDDQPMQLTHQL